MRQGVALGLEHILGFVHGLKVCSNLLVSFGWQCNWRVKSCCWYTAHWLLLLGDDQSHSDFNFVCDTVVFVHGSKVDILQLRRSLGNNSVSVTTAAFTKDGWQQTTSSLPRSLLLTAHNTMVFQVHVVYHVSEWSLPKGKVACRDLSSDVMEI